MLERRFKTGKKLDRVCRCGHLLSDHSKITPHRCIHKSHCACIAFDLPGGSFEGVRFDDNEKDQD